MGGSGILIVEDEFIVALDLQGILENLGYTVCGRVNSGEAALDSIASGKIDLVLMDVTLKGDLNGIETAALIRSRFGIPVIYVTADNALHLHRITGTDGPQYHVMKPFDEKQLKETIDSVYGQGSEGGT